MVKLTSDMTCAVCELPVIGTSAWSQEFISGEITHDCCMDQGEEPKPTNALEEGRRNDPHQPWLL